MFWQNFQIPCVFPGRESFGSFSLCCGATLKNCFAPTKICWSKFHHFLIKKKKKKKGGTGEILRPPDWPQFRSTAGQKTNFFLRVAWVPCIDLLSVSLVTSDLVPFPCGLSQLVPFAPCLYRHFSPHNFLLTFGPWPAHNIGGHKTFIPRNMDHSGLNIKHCPLARGK